MKISKGILLLLFSILLNDSFGKSKIASLIYNSKGELIADSSFRITKKQLKKFVKIEARFTKQLLDSIKIAPELIQDGIGFKVIVEFDVDEHSCFSNVNIIKIPPSPVEKFIRRHAQKTFIDQILQSSCQFEKDGFLSKGKKKDRYYIAIQYDLEKIFREIKNGWLIVHLQPPPQKF